MEKIRSLARLSIRDPGGITLSDRKKKKGAEETCSNAQLIRLPYAVIVSKLLIFLDAKDLLRLGETNRAMKLATDDSRLWHRLLVLDFSGPLLKASDLLSLEDFSLPQHLRPLESNESRRSSLSSRRHDSQQNELELENSPLPQSQSRESESQQQSQQAELQQQAQTEERTGREDNALASTERQDEEVDRNEVEIDILDERPVQTVGRIRVGTLDVERVKDTRQLRACSSPIWNSERETPWDELFPAKRMYIAKIREYDERVKMAAKEKQLADEIASLKRKRAKAQRWLWYFNFQFSSFLIFSCPLVTLALAAAQLDGVIPYQPWVMLSPMLVLFGVFSIVIGIGQLLLIKRHLPSSFFYGMYNTFRGLVQFVMHKIFRERRRPMLVALFTFVMLFLFMLFLGAKLNKPAVFSWIVTFIPLWLAFLAFLALCVMDGVRDGRERDSYIGFVLVMWLPLFTFFIVLSLYLEGVLSASFTLVMIPIWVLQGLLVVFWFFITFSLCLSRDKSEQCENIKAILVLFACIAPLVVFAILLVVKIERGASSSLSYTKVFAPLFFWFGFCFIFCVLFQFSSAKPTDADVSNLHPLVREWVRLCGARRDSSFQADSSTRWNARVSSYNRNSTRHLQRLASSDSQPPRFTRLDLLI